MIIDWEHHHLPEELVLKKGGKIGEQSTLYEFGKPRGDLNPELCDVEEQLRVMDAVGIDLAVLSMAVTSDDTQTAFEECRVWRRAQGVAQGSNLKLNSQLSQGSGIRLRVTSIES